MSRVKFKVMLRKIHVDQDQDNYKTRPIQHFLFSLSSFATNILNNLTIIKVKENHSQEYVVIIKAKNNKETIKTFLVALMGERKELYQYYSVTEIY